MGTNEIFGGGVLATCLSAIGTTTQTNNTLQTISLIITIIGGIISMVVLPLLTWYKNAKKDGKITKDEIDEAIDIVQDGTTKIIEETRKDKNK